MLVLIVKIVIYYLANYHKGLVEAYTLNKENSSINGEHSVIEHKGITEGQKPHTHFAAFTPDEKFITVVDLGIDQLLTYKLINDQLMKVSQLDLQPGSGPRHLSLSSERAICIFVDGIEFRSHCC